MKLWAKATAVTAAVAVPAFFLGPVIWPPADLGIVPTPAQVVMFLLLAVGDALLLGAGIAFIAFGLPLVRRVSPDSRARAVAMYVSIAYLMVSWWPHLNMHNANGLDLDGLLVIDYLFHLPLEVAAIVLGISFVSLLRARHRAGGAQRRSAEAPATTRSGAAR